LGTFVWGRVAFFQFTLPARCSTPGSCHCLSCAHWSTHGRWQWSDWRKSRHSAHCLTCWQPHSAYSPASPSRSRRCHCRSRRPSCGLWRCRSSGRCRVGPCSRALTARCHCLGHWFHNWLAVDCECWQSMWRCLVGDLKRGWLFGWNVNNGNCTGFFFLHFMEHRLGRGGFKKWPKIKID